MKLSKGELQSIGDARLRLDTAMRELALAIQALKVRVPDKLTEEVKRLEKLRSGIVELKEELTEILEH